MYRLHKEPLKDALPFSCLSAYECTLASCHCLWHSSGLNVLEKQGLVVDATRLIEGRRLHLLSNRPRTRISLHNETDFQESAGEEIQARIHYHCEDRSCCYWKGGLVFVFILHSIATVTHSESGMLSPFETVLAK